MPKAPREIPWLEKRGGTYYVFWYDAETRRTARHSLRTTDPKEAQSLYASFLSHGRPLYQGTEELGVSKCLDQYFNEHVVKNCAAPVRQETAIAHLKTHFGDKPIRLVDIPACREYASARRRKITARGPISDSTIRRELVVLGAAAYHAIAWKRLPEAHKPQIELTEESSPKVQFYSAEELQRIFDTDDVQWRRYLRVLYYTASRRRAIEKLEPYQVNLDHGTISLAKRGEKKTKKRRPVVPIFAEIRADIEAAMAEAVTNKSTYLFNDGRDTYDRYNRHCTKLGLGHKANPHVMRHTRATLALIAETPILKVANLLGDTVATVEKTYVHLLPDHLLTIEDGMSDGALRTNGRRICSESEPSKATLIEQHQWLD